MSDPTSIDVSVFSKISEVVKSSRLRRIVLRAGIVFVALVALGFFALPPLVKSLAVGQLTKILHRPVSIEQIDINPLALSLRIKGVSVARLSEGEQAGFDSLYVNLSGASLLRMAAVVDEIRLDGLRVAVSRVGDGQYDISDLLDEWLKPKDTPDTGLPRFSLNNIQLNGGRIVFDDQPRAKQHTISDIQFAIPFISTLPYQAEVLVQPMFAAHVNGAQMHLDGKSTPFASDRESELSLAIDKFDLGSLQAYAPAGLPLKLDAAILDSSLKAVFKEVSAGVYSLAVLGSARISSLQLTDVLAAKPLLAWDALTVDLEQADLINRDIAVRKVALAGLKVDLAVNRQGEMNVLALADRLAGKPEQSAVTETPAATPLKWSLGEFVLSKGLLRWQDQSHEVPVVGEVRELEVSVGPVDHALAKPIEIREASYQIDLGERFRVERMALSGIRVDLPGHRVDVAKVSNTGTRAVMQRNDKGAIEWVSSPILKTIRATDRKVQDSRPWLGEVAELNISDFDFTFDDKAVKPAAMHRVEGLEVHGDRLGNVPNSEGRLSLKARLNKQGTLEVAGPVQFFPLNVRMKVSSKAIPLNSLQAYAGEYLNVGLQRGQFSNEGEASVRIEREKLKAAYKGSATLGNLLLINPEDKSDFLKWKSLYLGGIDFKLDPMSLDIRDVALTDFYSRLVLSEAGRLNVADIVRRPQESDAAGVKTAATDAAPADVPPAAAAPKMPIKIGKITVNNGAVNFSDYFVKPNYTVSLAKLGGRISGLSSAENSVADLELRGSYANAAPVEILAKLNPLAAKSFLDLKAEIKGVDLSGFTPYSGKYAGYAIEKGKLSLDVSYKLENNQLAAENHLFIDQFTFGEKIDSPDATKLPVNLAIALLKNNRGEIDLNLPISGSLDDPQFSIGGLVVKVIVNLFVKAVTSPFALLGSLVGGGEELSNVAFPGGESRIDAAGAKKLEALAKALTDREALKLEITGRVDPETDREGLKKVAMRQAVLREKRDDSGKKVDDGESPADLTLTPEEYKRYLARAYKAAKFPKPRNFVGMQKELPVDEMEKLMLANLPAGDEQMKQLGKARAEAVQVWLIEQGKIAADRLFLVPSKAGDAAPEPGKGNRVDFSLK